MDLVQKVEIYNSIVGGKNALETIELSKSTGTDKKVEALISAGFSYDQIMNIFKTAKAETRGRKIKVIKNPLSEYFTNLSLGSVLCDNGDPKDVNINDVLIGVCNSFADNRDQKRSGLSPAKLRRTMCLSEITAREISEWLGVGDRQSRRYMKGAELLITLLEGKNNA